MGPGRYCRYSFSLHEVSLNTDSRNILLDNEIKLHFLTVHFYVIISLSVDFMCQASLCVIRISDYSFQLITNGIRILLSNDMILCIYKEREMSCHK